MCSAATATAARRVRFGDVVRLCTDRCAKPAAEGIERYVGLEHLEPGGLRVKKWGLVADGITFTNRFKPGQVLFGKRRAYQRKVAVADFEGVCSGDIYVFEPANGALHPSLLPFLCQTDAFYDHAVGTSAGSLSPRTNWKSLADFEFVLPRLEEQSRLVDLFRALESQFSDFEKLVMSARVVRKAASRAFFAQSLATFRRVSDCVTHSAYGPRFPSDRYSPNGNAFTIRTTDFSSSGGINYSSVPAAQLDPPTVAEHRLLDGDFLLSRSGEYAGMVRVFETASAPPKDYIPAAFLIRFRLNDAVLKPQYLLEYCQSAAGEAAVRGLARGSAQPNISGSAFLALQVPVPELKVQAKACADLAALRRVERLAVSQWETSRRLMVGVLNENLGRYSG
jgi:type I restriction enzyme S subunit